MAFPQLTKFRMEAYIQNLFQEKPDVALRIMIVRTLSAGSGRLLAGDGSRDSTSQYGTPPPASRTNHAAGSIELQP